MNGKYFPIGTVVLLKGAEKRIMVTGYCAVSSEEQNKVYDYSGVLFPEGMLTFEQTFLFNHNQICEIYHMGLVDEEQREYDTRLKDMMKRGEK